MADLYRSLNRLTKWRAHFAGWQLGTRAKGDPECDAVRDHREATIILRAESTTIVGVLLDKGIITEQEFHDRLAHEADELEQAFQKRWPGASAGDDGMHYDVQRSAAWMQHWPH